MKRYVILSDGATKEQQDALTLFLKSEARLLYWHWFADAWLVIDNEDEWTADKLRSRVVNRVPGVDILVLRAQGEWAGSGKPRIFEWIKGLW